MTYMHSIYYRQVFISWIARIVLIVCLLAIYLMVSGCTNTIRTSGKANSNVILQNGQLCLGLKADSESCTPIGGYDEKSDSAPLQSAK